MTMHKQHTLFEDCAMHVSDLALDFERVFASLTGVSGSVIMIDGGFCQYCHRRDGQVTIRIIVSNTKGAGQRLLQQLKELRVKGATSLLAKCPADLQSNAWYKARGFVLEKIETTKTGRLLNVWRMTL
jgi:hypothetical protein